MRTLLTALMLLAALTFAYAGGGCGGKCGGCAGAKSALAVPDCAPPQVVTFYSTLTPMLEACNGQQDSYIREHAEELHEAAHKVVKSDKCCDKMQAKPYKQAAKTLVKDTDRLKKLSKKSGAKAVYAQMQVVKDDFTRLTAACE